MVRHSERKSELHKRMRQLRYGKRMTQQEVAEYLNIDVLTYAHYEAGRRTPTTKILQMLGELYQESRELLGATTPIKTHTEYPKELLDAIERALSNYPIRSNNYEKIREADNQLKALLEPIMEIRREAFDLHDITISSNLSSAEPIQIVRIDMRAEELIQKCTEKLLGR